jgi:thiamine kinase-like enzyme
VMDLVDPVKHPFAPMRHASTCGGIPICLAAGAAQVEQMTPDVHAHLGSLWRALAKREDDVVAASYDYAIAWFDSIEARNLVGFDGPDVLARGDHNLSNFLLDGDRVRLVDFEYSGRGDRPSELSGLVEHISARTTPDQEWDAFLSHCELNAEERRRLLSVRRLEAINWLLLLLPGQPGHERSPACTVRN